MPTQIAIPRLIETACASPEAYVAATPHITWVLAGSGFRAKQSSGLSLFRDPRKGKWLIKNHSCKIDAPSGDIWQLAKYLLGKSATVPEIARFVADAAGLNLDDFLGFPCNEAGNKRQPRKWEPAPPVPYFPNLDASKPISKRGEPDFAADGSPAHRAMAQYFNQLGVTPATLEKYNVRALESVKWLQNASRQTFTQTDFAFAYITGNTVKMKRPNAPNDKPREMYLQFGGHYIFGFDQLPDHCPVIVIAAGEKDALTINQHLNSEGIFAGCLTGETATIRPELAAILRAKCDHLVCLYDNDKTGRIWMDRAEKQGIPAARIAELVNDNGLFLDWIYPRAKPGMAGFDPRKFDGGENLKLNDVADIVADHRGDPEQMHGLKLVRTAILRAIESKPVSAPTEITVEGNAGEYLTDALDRLGFDYSQLKNAQINAATGTGKGRLVKVYTQKTDRKAILIAPTQGICTRLAKREGATAFFGSSKKNRDIKGNESYLVTTAHSFPALLTRLKNIKEYDIFLDEAHGLTADGYRRKVLRKVHRLALEHFGGYGRLTGTPIYCFHPDLTGQKIVRYVRPEPRFKATILCANKTIDEATQLYIKTIREGKTPVLLLNDKGVKLESVLASLPGDIKAQTAIFNANEKEADEWQEIAQNGQISDGTCGVITTSVLLEGNDIETERDFVFITVGIFHSIHQKQFFARARRPKSAELFIIKSEDRKRKTGKFTPGWHAAKELERAEKTRNEMNNQTDTGDEKDLDNERLARKAIDQNEAIYRDVSGKWQVCPFHVSNLVFERETIFENYNDEWQKTNLTNLGFDVNIGAGPFKAVFSKKQKADAKEARKLFKMAKAERILADYARLENAPFLQHEIDRPQKSAICGWLKSLQNKFDLPANDALELLKSENVQTDKDYSRLTGRLAIWHLRQSKNYMRGGRLFALALLELGKHLKPGKAYTADQIRSAFCKSFKLAHFNVEKWKSPDSQPRRVLELFFDVEIGPNIGGRCNRNRTIILKNKCTFCYTSGLEKFENIIESPDFIKEIEENLTLNLEMAAAPF